MDFTGDLEGCFSVVIGLWIWYIVCKYLYFCVFLYGGNSNEKDIGITADVGVDSLASNGI